MERSKEIVPHSESIIPTERNQYFGKGRLPSDRVGALFDHMIEQGARNTMLSVVDGTADSGSSFDRYGESLTLY